MTTNFDSLSDQILAIKKCPSSIGKINAASEALKVLAVALDPKAIQHVKAPSLTTQLVAVMGDGEVIQHIDWPDIQVQRAAVRNNGCAIRFIDDPCREIQALAVGSNMQAIEHLQDPTEKEQQNLSAGECTLKGYNTSNAKVYTPASLFHAFRSGEISWNKVAGPQELQAILSYYRISMMPERSIRAQRLLLHLVKLKEMTQGYGRGYNSGYLQGLVDSAQ
jgi:hypothetical protein